MKISLLYKNEEKSAVTDAIYNLSIDRCAAVFCPDSARYDRFISVLSRPLTDPENILYRQAILNDFLNNPKLFDELKTIFLRYDKIKADWIELRSGAHVNEKGSSEAILSQTYSSLKVTSVFPRTIMSFFTSISDTLSSYKLSSPGLIYIRDYACRMLSDNNLEEIGKISALFVYNEADDYNYEVAISLSDDFKITGCELTNIEPKPKKQLLERQHKQYEKQLRQLYEEQMEPEKPESTDKKENKLYRLISGLSTKTKEKLNTESVIDRESFDTVMYILTEALSQIDNTLTKITGDIYEIFHGLSSEMQFYDAAIKYCEFVASAGVPLCTPKILPMENELTELGGLRDLFLICEGMTNEQIIPNDLSFQPELEGMLIRGSNNTGKTVFLRAVGIAQIFAQSGLPVCADNATVSVKSGIYSHFSAAEEDFTVGDTAGRFEGEVRCIANILDSIKPHALLLLNETFQTTAYSEGANGMYDILSVLPRLKTKYIFVTHLIDLYDRFNPEKTLLTQTILTSEEGVTGSSISGKRYTLTKVK